MFVLYLRVYHFISFICMLQLILLSFILSSVSSLVILSPSQEVLPHTVSTFGWNYNNNSIVGAVIESDPFDACQPLKLNATGFIVLAIRGGSPSCSFRTKVQNVFPL